MFKIETKDFPARLVKTYRCDDCSNRDWLCLAINKKDTRYRLMFEGCQAAQDYINYNKISYTIIPNPKEYYEEQERKRLFEEARFKREHKRIKFVNAHKLKENISLWALIKEIDSEEYQQLELIISKELFNKLNNSINLFEEEFNIYLGMTSISVSKDKKRKFIVDFTNTFSLFGQEKVWDITIYNN